MAFSTQRAVSDGTLTNLNVSIGYLKQADIQVFFDDLPAAPGTWAWVGATPVINFTPVVPNGVEVLLKRSTQISSVINLFTAGAGFTNKAMDTNSKQFLYLNQEAVEGAALTDIFNDVDFHGYRARNIATAVLPGDAVPLSQYQADVGAYVTAATTQAGIATTQAGLAAASAVAADASADAAAISAAAAAATVAPAIVAAPTKATPIDADSVPLVDSADSNALKRVTWANVKATLKTYFDSLYGAAVPPATVAPLANGTAAVGVATKYAREDHVHPAAATGLVLTAGTPVSPTGVAFVEYTGIPSTAKRINVHMNGLSGNGSSPFLVRIGPSGGVETTGYKSAYATSGSSETRTTGFIVTLNPNGSGNTFQGSLTINLLGGTTYCASGTGAVLDGNTLAIAFGGGKTTASAVTVVRITTENGTDNFDAGSVNVTWEV